MNRSNSQQTQDTIRWGNILLPAWCGPQGYVAIGGAGSGKSTILQMMMASVLPRVRSGTNCRGIVYDAKRDIVSILLGLNVLEDRIHILNPFDLRAKAWDMAADIVDPVSAMEIATILVPERSNEVQPFFPQAARGLLGGVIESFLHLAPRRWTLRDVVLTLRTAARLKGVLARSAATAHLIENYLSGTDAQHDIRATIENVMLRLAFIAAAWDRAVGVISLERWFKEESILVLGSNPSLESTIQQINHAILHRLTQMILNQPEAATLECTPYYWLFIDELRRAGRFPNLPEVLVEGRSKGLCPVLAFQDWPGLCEVYGQNLAREIFGICNNKAYLRITDAETAEFASRHFGNLELEVTRHSKNWGTSQTDGQQSSSSSQWGASKQNSYHTRPVIAAREFMKLPLASPRNGISAFFDTAPLGDPYFVTMPGEFITEHKPLPHPAFPNVDPRPREHQILREWDLNDLQRLGLEDHPELLCKNSAGAPQSSSSSPTSKGSSDGGSNEPGGLWSLLPKRNP